MLHPSKDTPEQQPAPLLWLTVHGHRPNRLAKEARATRQSAAGGKACGTPHQPRSEHARQPQTQAPNVNNFMRLS